MARSVDGQSQLGRLVREHFDMQLGFHPHVDTHVDTQRFIDKFLDDTDPEYVSLCLDTGHVEYCSGDNREIISRHPDRISYIHLKQVNPRVAAQARKSTSGSTKPCSEAPWSSRPWERRPCSHCSTTSRPWTATCG